MNEYTGDITYFNSVRDNFDERLNIKSDSIAQSLIANGYNYPFANPEEINTSVDTDSIITENYAEFIKVGKRITAKFKKLPKEVAPLYDTFKMFLGFKTPEGNEKVYYTPFVMDFEDGQRLIALVRQYGEHTMATLKKDEKMKVTKWILNEQDITKEVFSTRQALKDEATEVKNLTTIIAKNHKKFIALNPDADKNTKLEIAEAMDLLNQEEATLNEDISKLNSDVANLEEALKPDINEGNVRVTLPQKAEAYYTDIKDMLDMHDETKDLNIEIIVGDTKMDNITDEEVTIVGGTEAIQSIIKDLIVKITQYDDGVKGTQKLIDAKAKSDKFIAEGNLVLEEMTKLGWDKSAMMGGSKETSQPYSKYNYSVNPIDMRDDIAKGMLYNITKEVSVNNFPSPPTQKIIDVYKIESKLDMTPKEIADTLESEYQKAIEVAPVEVLDFDKVKEDFIIDAVLKIQTTIALKEVKPTNEEEYRTYAKEELANVGDIADELKEKEKEFIYSILEDVKAEIYLRLIEFAKTNKFKSEKEIVVTIPTDEYQDAVKEAIAKEEMLKDLNIKFVLRDGTELDSIECVRVGDVVCRDGATLNMTVENVNTDNISCTFFDEDNQLQKQDFPKDDLVIVDSIAKSEIKIVGGTRKIQNLIKKVIIEVAKIEDDKFILEQNKYEAMYEEGILEDTEKVKALSDEDYQGLGDYLTDENYHTEKVLLTAQRVGTSEDVAEAKELIGLHEKEGLTADVDTRRTALREKLEDKKPMMTKRQKEDNPYLVNSLIKDYLKDKSTPRGTVSDIYELIDPLLNAEDSNDREKIRKDIIDIFNDKYVEVQGFKNRFVLKEEPTPKIEEKSNLDKILEDEVYKQIMKDSMNGVMYDVSKKYKANHLIELWNGMSGAEQENAGGIVRGAMNFIKDQVEEPQILPPEMTPNVISGVKNSLITIHSIDKGESRGYDRKLFVSSVVNKIKTQAKNLNDVVVIETVDYIDGLNKWAKSQGHKQMISDRSPIWDLRLEAQKRVAEKEEPKADELGMIALGIQNKVIGGLYPDKDYSSSDITHRINQEIQKTMEASPEAFKVIAGNSETLLNKVYKMVEEQGFITTTSEVAKDYKAELEEFKTLTMDTLDRALEILEDVKKSTEENPEDEQIKSVYEEMGNILNDIMMGAVK